MRGTCEDMKTGFRTQLMNRRSFVGAAAGLGASFAFAEQAAGAEGKSSEKNPKQRIKLGIASYSYWHFKTEKVPIETVITKSAEIGVEGVDILHRQMELAEKE